MMVKMAFGDQMPVIVGSNIHDERSLWDQMSMMKGFCVMTETFLHATETFMYAIETFLHMTETFMYGHDRNFHGCN